MLDTVLAVPRATEARAHAIVRSVDLAAAPDAAFARLCEVEKWPVWLSIIRHARIVDRTALGVGAEVAVASAIPGAAEELYEVDYFIPRHRLSLVGAFSVRRRIDLRVERRRDRCRVVVGVDYPTFGGSAVAFVDRITARRRLASDLDRSLVYLKGLVEFTDRPDGTLSDF